MSVKNVIVNNLTFYGDMSPVDLERQADAILTALREAGFAVVPVEREPKVKVTGNDVWLQFSTTEGLKADLSIAAIAEKSGPITRDALLMWCQEQIEAQGGIE